MLVRTTDGEDWIDKPLSDFMATPWFKLENLDDDLVRCTSMDGMLIICSLNFNI